MNLEDHLGDIIRKGRKAANVSPEAAARAAGLTEAELAALEASGQTSAKPNLAAPPTQKERLPQKAAFLRNLAKLTAVCRQPTSASGL